MGGRLSDECVTSSQGGRTLSVTLCKWEKTKQKTPTQSTTLSVAKGKTQTHIHMPFEYVG